VRRLVALLLIFPESMHFANEVLSVLTTLPYRGLLAAVELVAHAGVAAFCVFAGLALWNAGPDARRLGVAAVVLSVARTIQSLYWSSLPDNTMPGDEFLRAFIAVALGIVAIVVIFRSTDG
jgi:hypothetical protein